MLAKGLAVVKIPGAKRARAGMSTYLYGDNLAATAQDAFLAPQADDWFAAATAPNKFNALHFSGYVRKRETMLPLPKWESSAVHFGPRALPWMLRPRQHRFRIRCTVSPESVVRSRLRADQAVRPPAEVKPVWKAPAEKPVAFEDLFIWFAYDHELPDEDRLDKTEIPKELHGVRSIPTRQRVYTAEEKLHRRGRGRGAVLRETSATSWSSLVPRRARSGTSMTCGRSSPSPLARINAYDLKVRQLTLQEVESAFPIMTTLANLLLQSCEQRGAENNRR